MTDWTVFALWLTGAALVLILLALRRPLVRLWNLAVRSTAGLALLAALSQIGPQVGISLGVNWVNALVLGILGAPGFGLLLMMQWLLTT